MARCSNPELVAEFRRLLTEGARWQFEQVGKATGLPVDELLSHTKPWRNEMWRQFNEIEDRLCPKPPK